MTRRPLPRLHAATDAAVLALDDLGVRAAALASVGAAIALHVRDRAATGRALAAAARRLAALARPAEAAVFVNGRPDLAAAIGGHGVQLAADDLAPADARRLLPQGWVGRSVHSRAEAEAAQREGVDYLLVGSIFATPSHPDRAPAGLELVRDCAALGLPVIAIGGMTPARAAEAREAGAWGVAAIRGLWLAPDPARAAMEFLDAWA